ncbi:MAG TPA: glycine cleavage system aminomethyltransferase GcvT [Dehalococcoidia bacterium]|nr:glycine cleavage system aminomethyltransferase GcvT [Dehalococcoidia bacterium]
MTSPPESLRRTALYDLHTALSARMTPFAGWEMPLQYERGIVDETRAVREHAGVFDVSHMGRLFAVGADAARLVRAAVTYDVASLPEGRGHYTLMCNEEGGILDDPYVYRLDAVRLLVVGNAVNAERDRDRLSSLLQTGWDAELLDRQAETVMLAVQGPKARELAARVVGPEAVRLERRACHELPYRGVKLFVSRTGYTGEDGVELVTSADAGRHLWTRLVAEGVVPCGLGARDILRLEAALPLWGQDIDETTNPFEAGLGWVVSFGDGAPFMGREALLRLKEAGVRRRLAHLKARERGVMRRGQPVLHGGRAVGTVTSGGYSPTLGVSIGMAYLPVELARVGTELAVDVRGRLLPVDVVARPFYRSAAESAEA